MCGRFAASAGTDELIEQLEIEEDHTGQRVRSLLRSPQDPCAGTPDYNMAPTKNARVVLARAPRQVAIDAQAATDIASESAQSQPRRQLRLLTWGLVPSWAKDPAVGARMTNARVETVATKPAFRAAFASRRALVPADGWYEWQVSPTATDAKGKPRKQPFFMHRTDGVPVTLAGLYEFWRDVSLPAEHADAWLASFTILTRAAEPGLDRIHDRQPVVLDPDQWTTWLAPTSGAGDVEAILAAHRPGRFAAYPIGRAVGNSRANGAALIEPVDPSELIGVIDPQTGEVIG